MSSTPGSPGLSPKSAKSAASSKTGFDSDSEYGEEEESEEENQSDVDHAEKEDSEPPTPPRTPPPEQVRRELAVEVTDRLFHRGKLHMMIPPRWTRIFLNAAEQFEKRLDEKREQLYMAVAQDDVELLLNVKKQVSEELFLWWSYDCNLVVRASHRWRADILKHLADLYGEPYPGIKKVTAVRELLDEDHGEGSSYAIAQMQRGRYLLDPLRKNLEENSEINVDGPGGLKDVLDDRASGQWRDTSIAAVGVNYALPHSVYAGWRPIHYVAANCNAGDTAVPALELLFEAKADATLVEAGGGTALHLAAMRGHLKVVNVLLEYGCPLDAEDLCGCSAMNVAARCRHYPIIKDIACFLLPPNAHDALFYTEAERLSQHYSLDSGLRLHRAVSRGSIEKAQELLNLEPPETANVNYADPGGRRSVHLAAGFISNEFVACDMLKILVGRKADINARDAKSETPLHVAARLGRAVVCKTILLLHAHPNIPDHGHRTPVMLAAVGPDEERVPPSYNGVLVCKPVSWTTIQDVLDWNGRGEAPISQGPAFRKVRGKAAKHVRELFGGKEEIVVAQVAKKKRRDSHDEEDEHEEAHEHEGEEEGEGDGDSSEEENDGYFTINDAVTARANALCELGFDDQRIIDRDGRVNRGDRIQLFQHLFQPSRNWVPQNPGDIAPLVPNDVRCRFVWKHLTGPLLQMEQKGILPLRPCELLTYVLRVMLGNKGPAFGVLVSYGYESQTLPLWNQIEAGLNKHTLEKRCEALLKMGFVGSAPKLAKWAGSKWDQRAYPGPDSYPRHPVYAPWGAFDYVDKDDKEFPPLVLLQKHNKYNVRKQEEFAFKDNDYPIFEPVPEGAQSLPSRQDQLCLSNRIFLNETAGVRKQVEARARTLGEKLICPLLTEFIKELDSKGLADENQERMDLLDYLGLVMTQPKDCYVYVNQPRRPFKDIWEDVEEDAIKVLCRKKCPIILGLGPKDDKGKIHHGALKTKLRGAAKIIGMLQTDAHKGHELVKKQREQVENANAAKSHLVTHECAMPHQGLDFYTKDLTDSTGAYHNDQFGQFALLNDDIKRWLLRAESTRAFIELKRCTCIRTCEEFSELVCSIAVGGLQDFHGRFWRAIFGLLLWGRSKLLKPILDAEVNRRLPKSDNYELKGPFLRPRSDVLGISELAVKAKAKLALMSSEPPWVTRTGPVYNQFGELAEQRPTLDFNAGKPGGGVTMPTGVALFTGFSDILYAQVLCDDGPAMKKAYDNLTGKPDTKNLARGGRRKSFAAKVRQSIDNPDASIYMQIFGRDGRTKFGVLRVINSLREDQQKVIPLCASVKLIATIGWTPLGYGPPIEQLVEIDIMLKATVQARWLAKYMNIVPKMMPRTRNEDEDWAPVTRMRKT